MGNVSLIGLEVENLRGYRFSSISINRPRTLLVGPNNSGKTSILRLLGWALNELDSKSLSQKRILSDEEQKFLLPARDSRHRARRLALKIKVPDARSWSKFQCDTEGGTKLRLNIRLTPDAIVYLSLGDPIRGETTQSQPNALELFNRLKNSVTFLHIPSFRDAKSKRFNTTLHTALRTRIEDRALHTASGGASREHRQVAQNMSSLRDVILGLAQPLWDDVSSKLPPGMAREGKLDFDCDQATFLQFLESRLRLRISTGDHDTSTVPIEELGSGLQSLLDLAFQETQPRPNDTEVIIAVEEPEAFLHPAAQRTVATKLLKRGIDERKVIITTHSPIVVEEATFGDVVMCRDHRFFEPNTISDARRNDINTSLLSGFGAEMVFGTSILLVEGEGDRQFFERLRRRIGRTDNSGELDTCFVVPVGSNTRFSPWFSLLNSYGDAGSRPIRWLAVPDGDSSTEIRRGFLDANITLRQELVHELGAITTAKGSGDLTERWLQKFGQCIKV